MSFDQEPERDAHDECRHEIRSLQKDSERLQFLIDNNARIEKHANLHWLIFYDGATMHDEVIEQQGGSYPSPREAIDAAMSEAEAENFPGFL